MENLNIQETLKALQQSASALKAQVEVLKDQFSEVQLKDVEGNLSLVSEIVAKQQRGDFKSAQDVAKFMKQNNK